MASENSSGSSFQALLSYSSMLESCLPRKKIWSYFLDKYEFIIKQKDQIKPIHDETWDDAWEAKCSEWDWHDRLNDELPDFKAADAVEGTTKSIAFMFLTVCPLNREDIWIRWFEAAAREKYNIYVHSDKEEPLGELERLATKVQPATKTGWATSGLVRATMLMLREALKNGSNTHFILLSNSDIPLYSFDELYDRVTSKELSRFNKMTMNFDTSFGRNIWKAPDALQSNGHAWQGCNKPGCRSKADQWAMWNRSDATFFAENNFLRFLKPRALFVDEPFFIQLMYQHDRKFEDAYVTFTKWKLFVPSPDNFTDSVPDELLEKARKADAWFFRKVGKEAKLPIEYKQRVGII